MIPRLFVLRRVIATFTFHPINLRLIECTEPWRVKFRKYLVRVILPRELNLVRYDFGDGVACISRYVILHMVGRERSWMYVRTLYTQGCSVSYRGAQTISKHAQVVPSGYNLERQLADKSAAHHANIAASVRACFELTRLL